MNLSAPTQIVFLITLVLAAAAILAALGVLAMVPVIAANAFWILAAAYIILAIACMMKGI